MTEMMLYQVQIKALSKTRVEVTLVPTWLGRYERAAVVEYLRGADLHDVAAAIEKGGARPDRRRLARRGRRTVKYRVTGTATSSVHVDVEARSEAEARALAEGAPMQQLCHACSAAEDGAWSTSGELDGEPTVVDVRRLRGDRRCPGRRR